MIFSDYRLIIVKVVVIAVLIYALYKLIQKLAQGKSQGKMRLILWQNTDVFLQKLENATPPPEEESGEVVMYITLAQAGNIANIQFQAMDGNGLMKCFVIISIRIGGLI